MNSTVSNLPEYSCIKKERPSVETIVYVDLSEYQDEKKVPHEDGVNVVYVEIPHDNYEFKMGRKSNSGKYVRLPDSKNNSKYSYETLNDDSDSDYSCATADSQTTRGHVICKNSTKKYSHQNGNYIKLILIVMMALVIYGEKNRLFKMQY